jgi:peroxiredoxin
MTMALSAGQKLESGVLYCLDKNKMHQSKNITDVFAGRRVVVFMGPAPFSKLDTEQALEYEKLSTEILAEKVDAVIGIYVQDAFVMKKFQEQISTDAGSSNIEFYGDGDGLFVKANNLMHDFTFQGLSTRCGRWAFVVNDGVIEYVVVDDYQLIEQTSAASILKQVKNES